jgi:predicted AAA+ superfamily ATPase
MEKLIKNRNNGMVKILTGMRRVGKSTLLFMLQEELKQADVEENQILYLNMESMMNSELLDYKMLHKHVMSKAIDKQKVFYIMIDEIQNVQSWERCISSLMVDLNCDIYITGSNSNLFSSELATLMSGRYLSIPVYPLSFSEFLEFNRVYHGKDIVGRDEREQLFWEYLRKGGLPGLFRIEDDPEFIRQFLTDIFNSVVLKDVVLRNNIRNTELLQRVILYLMDNIGNILSAKKIVDFLKSQGRKHNVETLYTYLDSLQDALVFHKVRRYDLQGKKFLETMEKYYTNDFGLRYALLGFDDKAISGLLENVVYLELLNRGYSVSIGKQNHYEVDFVATKGNEKWYLQVSYLIQSQETLEREYRSFLNIKDNYRKTVLTMENLPNTVNEGIERTNLIDFLLARRT